MIGMQYSDICISSCLYDDSKALQLLLLNTEVDSDFDDIRYAIPKYNPRALSCFQVLMPTFTYSNYIFRMQTRRFQAIYFLPTIFDLINMKLN